MGTCPTFESTAARFHSIIAGRIKLRNTLPPLASNDLLCGKPDLHATFEQRSPRILPNVRVRMFEKRSNEFIVLFVTDNAKNLETSANKFRIIGSQKLKGGTTDF